MKARFASLAALTALLIGSTFASAGAPARAALSGTMIPAAAQPAADRALGGLELHYTGANQMARSYGDCNAFPGYLCVWDGVQATGRLRVFNNTLIGTGISFDGTSWNNVITNAWNTASSTTYRFWTSYLCGGGAGFSGTYSPGAIGGWPSSSVFYQNISGLTVNGDNTCT